MMSAGVRTLPTGLEIINEVPIIDRKLSCSPEPIDTGAPAEPAQTPAQQWQSSGVASPFGRAGTGDSMPATAEIDDGIPRQDSGGAYDTSVRASRRNPSRRNTGEASPTIQAPPRQSTADTKYSLSFEETKAWNRKAVLSLGTRLPLLGLDVGLLAHCA